MNEDFRNNLRMIVREELIKVLNTNGQQKLLTTNQVAEMLGLKEQTLNLWRCRGDRGPSYLKISGAVRYRLEEVEKWVDEQNVGMG